MGPVNPSNRAEVFRLNRSDGYLDLFRGQVVTVGDEITQTEAEYLLHSKTWKFVEVNE